jgi:CRISPR-associated protein Cmr2
MNDEFWALKIVALLHDPPGKMLGLANHEKRAFEAIEEIVGTATFQDVLHFSGVAGMDRDQFEKQLWASKVAKRIKKADKVASAIDRAAFPSPETDLLPPAYLPRALTRHPFSGGIEELCRVRAMDKGAAEAAAAQQLEDAKQLAAHPRYDIRQKYLRLWRGLPYTAGDETRYLAADSRMADHTLWPHLDATAALASALPQPAFLHLTIGPVQSFIAEARRTQDLWMGSLLLSYMIWAGIRAIAERFGPDVILYPALRGQPLVDRWLKEEMEIEWEPTWGAPPREEQLSIATLPNIFVALLPASEAADWGEKAAGSIRECWQSIAQWVYDEDWWLSKTPVWEQIWQRQVGQDVADSWPDVYWSVLPWPDTDQFTTSDAEAEAAKQLADTYLGQDPDTDQMWRVYKKTWRKGTNAGTFYGRLHTLASHGLGARKGLRNFVQAKEKGEKCTVSGVRSALRWGDRDRRDKIGEDWGKVAAQLREEKNRYHEVNPDGSERLSAVVAVKRFAQRAYFQRTLGLRGGFPSTSRMAAAPWLAAVLRNLAPAPDPQEEQKRWVLRKALRRHLLALKRLGYPKLSKEAAGSLPYLCPLVEALRDSNRRLARVLLRYDADVLYEGSFDPRILAKEHNIKSKIPEKQQAIEDKAIGTVETLRSLCAAARGVDIRPPDTYYAVLLMDGDRMGKWLAGANSPLLRDLLHPAVLPKFARLTGGINKADATDWQPVLETRRPLSAAGHDALSQALANFALRCVRQVVEVRYAGRVVYAGGDDLLVFLPARDVLQASRELRALFSGQAFVDGDKLGRRDERWIDVIPDFHYLHSGYLHVGDELLLTMGPRASASAGIAIAHHKAPLDGVLEAARQAEKDAKDLYGRNAICVYGLKRSGAALRVGAQWTYEGMIGDTIGLLETIREFFADERKLSSKLAFDAREEARALEDMPDAHEVLLKLLFRRHSELQSDEAETQAEVWAPRLAALAEKLQRHRNEWQVAWEKRHNCPPGSFGTSACPTPNPFDEDQAPQPGPIELANWLLLLRFLEQGGGE